jgi:hypothetical protein
MITNSLFDQVNSTMNLKTNWISPHFKSEIMEKQRD